MLKISYQNLTLLHGVIDSPEIPLNVSRSYLADSNVKKYLASLRNGDKLIKCLKKTEKILKTNG